MTSVLTPSSPAGGRTRAAAAAAVLLLALAGPVSPAAADAVVLTSSLPDLDPGDRLADDARVDLPAGSSLSVITRTGRTVTLVGPYSGPMDGAGTAAMADLGADADAILTELLTGGYDDLSSVGASRSVGDPAAGTLPGDPMAGLDEIDVDLAGVYCIDPTAPPGFRRGTDSRARVVPVLGAAASAEIAFAQGVATAPWPAALPLVDGAVYNIAEDPAEPTGGTLVVLRVLDRAGRDDVAWVLALARAGCGEQAARALAAYRETAVALSVYLTSDRGQEPVYRLGEPVQLRLRANRNAYIYCYALQSDGSVVPLFPIDGSRGPGLAANAELEVPGDRWPGRLEAVPPAGEDRVRCYGAAQDITERLPATVVPFAHTPLPSDLAGRLDEVFEQVAARDAIEVAVAELRLVTTRE